MSWVYPAGSFAALLASDATTVPTRAAFDDRAAKAVEPSFFGRDEHALLSAVVGRLAPRPGLADAVAAAIDARLAAGQGNGWRYAELPNDGDAYRAGLVAIEARGFLTLSPSGQDAMLIEIQGQPETARFFEELLAEVTEFAYAQPSALAAIGYAGVADAPGWTVIGLDEREPREAVDHG